MNQDCPRCRGAGGWEEYLPSSPHYWWPTDEGNGCYWESCPRCKGTGEINLFKEAVEKAVIKCGKVLPDV